MTLPKRSLPVGRGRLQAQPFHVPQFSPYNKKGALAKDVLGTATYTWKKGYDRHLYLKSYTRFALFWRRRSFFFC